MTPANISTLVDAFYDGLLGNCPVRQPLDLLRANLRASHTVFTYKPRASAADHVTISSDRECFLAADAFETGCHAADSQGWCDDGAFFCLRVTRPCTAQPFESAETEVLATLVPHIKRALSLCATLQVSKWERQLYSGILDRLKVGTIVLDERGQILKLSEMAQDVVDEMDGLKLIGGHLHAVSPSEDRHLQALIKAVLTASDRSKVRPQALSLPRPSGSRDLGLVVQSVCATGAYTSMSRAAVAIFLRAADQGAEVEYEILRQLFDLTPAEASVASRLAEGLSLEEAANDLDVSLNTVRAHLRSIFSKNGITRQTHLVRMLLNSAAVLGTRSDAIMLDL
jgi:DNA-binding CsgD family transcriptional regulator